MKTNFWQKRTKIVANFISRHVKGTKPLSVINLSALELHNILHDNSDILSEQINDVDILRLFNFLQSLAQKHPVANCYRRCLSYLKIDEKGFIVF